MAAQIGDRYHLNPLDVLDCDMYDLALLLGAAKASADRDASTQEMAKVSKTIMFS